MNKFKDLPKKYFNSCNSEVIDSWKEGVLNIAVIDRNKKQRVTYGDRLCSPTEVLNCEYRILFYQNKVILIINTEDVERPHYIDEVLESITIDFMKQTGVLEARILRHFGKDYLIYQTKLKNKERYDDKVGKKDRLKTQFKQAIDTALTYKNKIGKEEVLFEEFNYEWSDEYQSFIYRIDDIVCEDTKGRWSSFTIPYLIFTIDTNNSYVNIVDGKYKSRGYSGKAFHPHQLTSSICMGTLEPDVIQAFEEGNWAVLNVLIHQFASTYNSDDSAGQHANYFIRDEKDRNEK